MSLSAGISGGQQGPQAQTDGQAANQLARTVLPWSTMLPLPGAPGAQTQDYTRACFSVVFLKIRIPKENILKKKKVSPPPPPPPC